MGVILLISFVVFAIMGVPIAFVLGLSSMAAIRFGSALRLVVVPQRMFTAVDTFPLLAIPLFMIAGSLMDTGGISRRLVNLANEIVGRLTGGLALMGILTCMFFAAISGSGPATVAAIGGIMIPYMVKAGYDKGFAAAIMATAGAIGVIIPPSIPMITYATMSNVSVGGLFTAGFGPGILVGLSLMAAAWWISKKRGYGGEQEKFTWKALLIAVKDAFWALLMPFIILGGIYGGVFTPTEAAGVAVMYGFFIGTFVYRELPLKKIPQILTNAACTTAMIMFIISTAQVFGWIMTSERIPDAVARQILNVSDNKIVILLIINVILLIVGCFMETNASLILFAPIFLPIAVRLGVSPIHFGIIMIVNLAIGMSTPPLGVNLYVACGITKITLERISAAVVPFIAVNVAALFIITYLEPVAMFLPRLFGW